MHSTAWDNLLALNRKLATGCPFSSVDVEDSVFELDAESVEAEMFLAAARRLADRRGFDILRVNVPGNAPDLVLAIGQDTEDARRRMLQFYSRRVEDEAAGIED